MTKGRRKFVVNSQTPELATEMKSSMSALQEMLQIIKVVHWDFTSYCPEDTTMLQSTSNSTLELMEHKSSCTGMIMVIGWPVRSWGLMAVLIVDICATPSSPLDHPGQDGSILIMDGQQIISCLQSLSLT